MTRMRIADVRDAGDNLVEGAALAMRLHDVDLPRPGTYQLADELLRAAGTSVAEVRIVRLTDMVFYAQVLLADGAAVDARPSDALNLALVTGAPIHVDERVLAAATPPEQLRDELAASTRDAQALAEEGRERLAEERRRLDALRR